ncbi:unnamed protein product [Leuciscus chuanchicus]
MGPKSDPASRSPALSPVGLWNPLQVASQFQSPLGPNFKSLAQEPFGLQEKQLLQGPVKPLDWRYPTVPEVQSELVENFPMRQPVTPGSVAVQCGENRVLVEVQQDLFSNGQLIQPTGLSLGGCPVVGQDPESRVLIFEYELQDCNSVLMMNEDELVYTFSLTYTPEALAGTPITRSDGAIVGVQCHYPRLQNVSSDALRPTWFPYASTKAGEEVLMFSLKIMMDDWSYQRPSYTYFLGGVINIEASVKQYNHVPLRVFVDRCVATQVPDVNSLPRFSFIENHGCFVDAKTTASSSRFMPRSQVDKLQFQLEAFMFQEGNSPSIYITCILKATIASAPSDAQRKSCSFANGWSAADGNDQVCGCCDSTCGPDGEFAASPYGGGCPVVGQDPQSRVLLFDYELQNCISLLMMNEDELVYTFSLTYTPEALADDWSYQGPSYSYFLGDVINIEASVYQYNHVPLRVFVDRCVATQVPDVNSLPRYSFIENHGCFVDAKTTASSSRFMPRSQVDKIHFQLEAFMFHEGNSLSVYITNIMR